MQKYRLGEEPGDDLSAFTTVEERLAMVWGLNLASWQLAGKSIPDYPRGRSPGRLVRQR